MSRVLDLVRRAGVLRPRDLEAEGIPRVYLSRLTRQGKLKRIGRGLYTLADVEATAHHSYAEASKRIPKGVVCLLSALRFHELTTQNPFEVWMAIDQHGWRPKTDGVPVRIVHMSGASLSSGVETHSVEGVEVPVYSAAKTVADCFKFRSTVGLDVALESLRDFTSKFPAQRDELWRFARICRVTKTLRPYLEALG